MSVDLPFNICASCVYFPLLVGVLFEFVICLLSCSFVVWWPFVSTDTPSREGSPPFRGNVAGAELALASSGGFHVYCCRLRFVSFLLSVFQQLLCCPLRVWTVSV